MMGLRLQNKWLWILVVVGMMACSDDAPKPPAVPAVTYTEITWDDLLPEDYQPEQILQKYETQITKLNELEDGDPNAVKIFETIQNEFNLAPANAKMDKRTIKLAGFIAPLEVVDGKIGEFLLVPYFGACIHAPPPPVNQTVWVKVRPGSEITTDAAVSPFWVSGTIEVSKFNTDIGDAGYVINGGITEMYVEE
jgi:uncharacterized protein